MFRKMSAISAVTVLLLLATGTAPATVAECGIESFRSGLVKLFPKYAKGEEYASFTYRLLDASGNELGRLYLEDAENYPRRKGYADTIEVAVATSTDGKIAGVVLGKNRETPSFITRLERQSFFGNWNGLTLSGAGQKKVDAVTRVTYSSEAIIASVQGIAERQDSSKK